MKPISLTFRVRGRQAKAKLPPLPQDLRDTLEHCITWMPAPSSHMPGLCLCDEEHFQRWLDHISDLSLSLCGCGQSVFSAAIWSSSSRGC